MTCFVNVCPEQSHITLCLEGHHTVFNAMLLQFLKFFLSKGLLFVLHSAMQIMLPILALFFRIWLLLRFSIMLETFSLAHSYCISKESVPYACLKKIVRLYVVHQLYHVPLALYFDSLSYPLLCWFWHSCFTYCGLLLSLSFQESA